MACFLLAPKLWGICLIEGHPGWAITDQSLTRGWYCATRGEDKLVDTIAPEGLMPFSRKSS